VMKERNQLEMQTLYGRYKLKFDRVLEEVQVNECEGCACTRSDRHLPTLSQLLQMLNSCGYSYAVTSLIYNSRAAKRVVIVSFHVNFLRG
jgi:hypothetical protein